PPRQQGSCQLIGMSIEPSVRPLSVAVDGRNVVRVCPSSLLEQLVDPAVWQLSARSGEAVQLETQLLGGEQGLSPVLSIWIGRDGRQRGEVIGGDRGGADRAEHGRRVAQPQQ